MLALTPDHALPPQALATRLTPTQTLPAPIRICLVHVTLFFGTITCNDPICPPPTAYDHHPNSCPDPQGNILSIPSINAIGYSGERALLVSPARPIGWLLRELNASSVLCLVCVRSIPELSFLAINVGLGVGSIPELSRPHPTTKQPFTGSQGHSDAIQCILCSPSCAWPRRLYMILYLCPHHWCVCSGVPDHAVRPVCGGAVGCVCFP